MTKEADEGRDNVVINLSSNVSANSHFATIEHQKPIIVGSTIGSQLGSPVSMQERPVFEILNRM